jgi:hypothetical protein
VDDDAALALFDRLVAVLGEPHPIQSHVLLRGVSLMWEFCTATALREGVYRGVPVDSALHTLDWLLVQLKQDTMTLLDVERLRRVEGVMNQ